MMSRRDRESEAISTTAAANSNSNNRPDNGRWKYAPVRETPKVQSNPLFEKFYGEANPLFTGPDAATRFADFVKLIETSLKTTFWINDTDPLAAHFTEELKQVGAGFIEPVRWYPQRDGAWRVLPDVRTEFRKNPDVQPLRQLMIRLTALGIISRQEEVSMVPPLILEIKKDDRVLDCCAAPGSKTAQCLVAIGRDALSSSNNSNPHLQFDYANMRGLVVANELDERRSNMLVHQCKRIRSLYPFAVFTNHDARFFPNPITTSDATTPQQQQHQQQNGEFFDKVLCDVMCSGDGTLRKAPALLRAWRSFEAAHLQKSQIQVALRGVHLLKVGGRLAYSTCSMSPIENEAVVSQILLRTNGAVRLIDPRPILPHLACDPGFKTWRVMRNDGTIADAPEPAPGLLHPALFPVPDADYPLERCMRMLPHHTDGGGFFIALFEKVAPWSILSLSAQQENSAGAAEAVEAVTAAVAPLAQANAAESKKMKMRDIQKQVHQQQCMLPFSTPPREIVENDIVKFFDIDPAVFPVANLTYRTNMTQAADQARNKLLKGGPQNNNANDDDATTTSDVNPETQPLSNSGPLQLTATGVRDLLLHPLRNKALRISAAGLRAFVPQLGIGSWRISNEAAPILCHCIRPGSARMLGSPTEPAMNADDVVPMINSGPLKDLTFDQIKDEALRSRIEAIPLGCFLLFIRSNLSRRSSNSNGGTEPIVVVCPALRARTRVQLLVDTEDLAGLQCRLGLATASNGSDAAAIGGAGGDEENGEDA